jgi:hypothetical protein
MPSVVVKLVLSLGAMTVSPARLNNGALIETISKNPRLTPKG